MSITCFAFLTAAERSPAYRPLTLLCPCSAPRWPWKGCSLPPVTRPPHQVVVLSAVPPGRSMEVTVPSTLSVLNGSDTRLPCTFNSCYTVNHKQFSLNWTYQECNNCSEEMVSPCGGARGGKQEPQSTKPTIPILTPALDQGPRGFWVGCLKQRA